MYSIPVLLLICAVAESMAHHDSNHPPESIYAPSYANVYYNQANGASVGMKFGELNSPQQTSSKENSEVDGLVNESENKTRKESEMTPNKLKEQVELVEGPNVIKEPILNNGNVKSKNPQKLQEPKLEKNATEIAEDPTDATEHEFLTEPESEQVNFERLTDTEMSNLSEQGIYYIYHPNGLLQKVVYATKESAEESDSGSDSEVKYQPIREAIYTYDPQTFVFQRLQIVKNTEEV